MSAKGTTRIMYAVSSGSYSDYGVQCLCETEQDAEAVAAKLRSQRGGWHNDAFVESFYVADASVETYPLLTVSVDILDKGTTENEHSHVGEEWPFDQPYFPARWYWVRAPIHAGRGGRLEVSGGNHKLVRKVFTEKRALFMADKVMASQRGLQGEARR